MGKKVLWIILLIVIIGAIIIGVMFARKTEAPVASADSQGKMSSTAATIKTEDVVDNKVENTVEEEPSEDEPVESLYEHSLLCHAAIYEVAVRVSRWDV